MGTQISIWEVAIFHLLATDNDTISCHEIVLESQLHLAFFKPVGSTQSNCPEIRVLICLEVFLINGI